MKNKHLLSTLLLFYFYFGERCSASRRNVGNFPFTVIAFCGRTHSNLGKQQTRSRPNTTNRIATLCRSQNSFDSESDGQNDNKKERKKVGYKFGDFTKSFVTKITKKEDYVFGDLSRYIDSRVKDQMSSFANKEDYEFGDVTKEILRRVASKDFEWKDMVMLMKVLLSFGVGLNPIASLLPIKFLIDLLNYSIYADVGDRFVGAITLEVDKRMKKAFTGDPEYQMGDLSKKAILSYIGKDKYDFGDVTKKVLKSLEENKKDLRNDADGMQSADNSNSFLGKMDEKVTQELEIWDTQVLRAEELAMKKEAI